MKLRELYRHAYDGNFEYCIKMLAEAFVEQGKINDEQRKQISQLNKRLQVLEKHSKITQEVINPLIEDSIEPMSLMDRIEESQKLP